MYWTPHNRVLYNKSAVCGSSSSLPLPVGGSCRLVCESVVKANLVSDNFDSKQSKESVAVPLTCHPSPSLIMWVFGFRSSDVRRLMLDFDLYGGTDPFGLFLLFLKKTGDVLAPRLSVAFRRFFIWVISLLAVDRPILYQSRKVYSPSLLLITN